MSRLAINFFLIGAWLIVSVGCGRTKPPSLERFKAEWHTAVNQRETGRLFDLLDSRSRRWIEHDLEVVRGLDNQTQQALIDQLGGQRVENLHATTPQQYFERLWHLALQGARPTMKIEAHGDEAAYMVLAANDRNQRIQLMVEAGQWVWVLPEQSRRTGAAGGFALRATNR